MRGERATLGKSLLDVQRDLKIKASYVAAIENCDVSCFESPGFVPGYVRSYARYLGLDPDETFARFCAESGFMPAHGLPLGGGRGASVPSRQAGPELTDPFGNPRAPFVPRGEGLFARVEPGALGSLFVLALLIAGVGYGGWSVLQEVQRVQVAPVDQAPGVVADLDPLAGVAPVAPVPSDVAGFAAPDPDAVDRLYRPAALDAPVLVARDGPIAAIDPRSFGALAGEEGEEGAATAIAEATADPGDTPVKVVEDQRPHVEILAVRPAWVRVQSADGTVLLEKILDAGERYVVPQTEVPARLRAGNSGAVYFVVHGDVRGPAAPGAQVVRNVALSAEALAEAFAVADPARDADLRRMVAVAEARTP
ncbi:MAG: DUF4115 domain-containing protein [Rhodobacteraceae bacterium]|nr:DUF4115 domain-containing protein [Paracoccaceae bacterium]